MCNKIGVHHRPYSRGHSESCRRLVCVCDVSDVSDVMHVMYVMCDVCDASDV